jgi:DNA helicase-2/ATP-dependent DNA helicase PcrA
MKNSLNQQQKEAAEAPNSPLLIVAGAGTGKTRTLAHRLLRFIENGILPHKICAITFTNKAAHEMLSRVRSEKSEFHPNNPNNPDHSDAFARPPEFASGKVGQVDLDRDSPFIGTFHSLGAKILRKESRLLKRKSNFVIFDDRDSFDVVKKITKKLSPPDKAKKRGDGVERRTEGEKPAFFAIKISEIKNTDGALDKLRQSKSPEDKLTLAAFGLYEKELVKNNAFDFDDLIDKTVHIFKSHPAVLEKYRNKFDAILVDEYQDLNPKQYELVKLLAGGHKNLSAVGDDEQMIYGWRYANLKTFLNFERDWPGAKVCFLEENYRSSGNIIQAASAITKNNLYRFPKNIWTKNPSGSLIKLFEANDEDDEAEWIAKTIFNSQFSISKKDISQTTAVLYRTNAQPRAIEQALIRHQIPYKIFGGLKFYERKEVKDVVAALRCALNGKDELSRERLEKLLSGKKLSEFKEKIGAISVSSVTPLKLMELFLKTTDYFGYLQRNFTNYGERQENIAELVNFASDFDNLAQFLEEIALVQATDMPSAGTITITNDDDKKNVAGHGRGQIVQLSTIHLAKGLEFDRVFMAGCSEGLLPHARSLENEYELEEERRLMYVAMTRAKKDLAVSFYDVPSRFISELPTEFLEFKNGGGLDFFNNDYDEEKSIYLD